MTQPCTICNSRSIPGLIKGAGKCQYHYNVGQFGKEWAGQVLARTVQTVYRGHISFDAKDWDSVGDGLLKMGRGLDHCSVFTGNSACFPYVTVEDENQAKVQKYLDKAVRYILRRKEGKVNP